jgi:hypothetical protein
MINATGFLPLLEFRVKDVITAILEAKSGVSSVSSSLIIKNPGFSGHFTKHFLIRIYLTNYYKFTIENISPTRSICSCSEGKDYKQETGQLMDDKRNWLFAALGVSSQRCHHCNHQSKVDDMFSLRWLLGIPGFPAISRFNNF